MKLSKKIRLFLALIISLTAVSIYLFKARLEISSASYKSYDEVASIPNIFEAGWIPVWLPKSAVNIKESHDIDTNASWLMFNFLESDVFYKTCSPALKNDLKFSLFSTNNLKELNNNSDLVFYICDDAITRRFLAIDKQKQAAYVWTVEH